MSKLDVKSSNNGVKTQLPICFALDQDWKQGIQWIERLKDMVWGFKVGSILFTECGPQVVQYIKEAGSRVFLDLKFFDIPNTMQRVVRQAFSIGADWVTVHSMSGEEALKRVADEQDSCHRVFGVTVLTSFDQKNLRQIGISSGVKQSVENLADLATSCGINSFVCSVEEAKSLRGLYPECCLLTPGIRLKTVTDDQKRSGGAREAFESGANYIVLGRALSESQDWKKTWAEIDSSLAGMF